MAETKTASVTPIEEKIAKRRAEWFVIGKRGGRKFVPKRAADALSKETPVARGGQTLWTFNGNGYGEGEEDLRQRIAETLGEDWKRAWRDETINLLLDRSPRLWDEPPPDRVGVANGILDLSNLRSPRLDPPSAEFLSTVQIAAAYERAATCPRIDAFIEETVGAETAPLIYELAGYLITPDNSLQSATMFLGKGENGKSTMIRILEALLGQANVSHVSLQKLEEDKFAAADLYGRLLNTFADLDARALKSSSMFKAVTGGDVLRGERKFRDPFNFTPSVRFLFSANDPPPVNDSSHAFFRRWVIVPFERSFPVGVRDEKLIDKLTTPEELSGLLNRALTALPGLRERGAFLETEATRRAAVEFRFHADSVTGYVDDCCIVSGEAEVPRKVLYEHYTAWCQVSRRAPLTAHRFYDRIRDLGTVGEKTVRGRDFFTGISHVGRESG